MLCVHVTLPMAPSICVPVRELCSTASVHCRKLSIRDLVLVPRVGPSVAVSNAMLCPLASCRILLVASSQYSSASMRGYRASCGSLLLAYYQYSCQL